MAYQCDNCGKGIMIGISQRHKPGVAGGRWIHRAQRTKKVFKPNLQHITFTLNGQSKRMFLCTRCIRLMRTKLQQKPSVETNPDVQHASI